MAATMPTRPRRLQPGLIRGESLPKGLRSDRAPEETLLEWPGVEIDDQQTKVTQLEPEKNTGKSCKVTSQVVGERQSCLFNGNHLGLI